MPATYENIGVEKTDRGASKRIQWYRSPLGMMLSLLTAIVLCVGHDQFYRRLDGRQIATALSQIWAVRVATVLALLINALLVLAVSIAFVQRQWLVLRRNSVKIGRIDSLTGVLHDLTAFADPHIWLKTPLLTLVAIVAWLLPLTIIIITPSTLIVTSDCQSTNASVSVPQLSFDTYKYSIIGSDAESNRWKQPSRDVTRIAFATATTGEILSNPHNEQSMTYDTRFWGPTVQCAQANDTVINSISQYFSRISSTAGPWSFYAFVPGDAGMAPVWTSCDPSVQGSSCLSAVSPSSPIDMTSTDAARIWIMSSAETCQAQNGDCYRNVTECSLHNATYDATFTSSGVNQGFIIKSVTVLEPLAVLPSATITESSQASDSSARNNSALSMSTHESYQSVMAAFGALLVGYQRPTGSYMTLAHLTAIDWSDMSKTQAGLEQLFHNITLSLLSSPSLVLPTSPTTSVQSTTTTTTCPPTYRYHPRPLYISYGLSIIATLLCVLLGMHALVTNQACYTNKFSTYIRTTRGLTLKKMLVYDGKVDDNDCGQNPLPREIGKMKVELGGPGSATKHAGSSSSSGYSMIGTNKKNKDKNKNSDGSTRRHDTPSMFQMFRETTMYGGGGGGERSGSGNGWGARPGVGGSRPTRGDTRGVYSTMNVQTSFSGGTMGTIGQNMSRYNMI